MTKTTQRQKQAAKEKAKTACHRARAWLKIASRKKLLKTGEAVFVQSAQTITASGENAYWYGESASGDLYYNYYRNYNPATGGYLQSDPMGLFGGSFSTYSYVGGNPLRKYDSTGLCAQDISKPCLNALAIAGANASALTRASDNMPIISAAALANGIDPALLAAIGIRETGYQNIAQQGGGDGKGVYQIDTGKNPSVTSAQAYDIQYASNYAANMLSSNFDRLLSQHPNLGYMQLWQATADSYNFGTGNISGNPDTIDVGSTHNNYGSNVMDIMLYCFILGGAK